MIYAWEELTDIAGENVTKTAGEVSDAVEGFVSSLSDSICIGIEEKRLFEDRLDQVA